MRRRFRLPFATLAIAATVTGVAATSAAGFSIQKNPGSNLDGKIVLSPAAERVSTVSTDGGGAIAPGMRVTRQVLVQNRSTQTTQFDLDISQVVGSNAEVVVEIRHGVRQGAAAWAQLERRYIELAPGEVATVNVTIDIPKAVKPGSKPFAVTATQRAATTQTTGAGVTPIFRQVAIFIVELPGDAPTGGKITRAEVVAASDTLRRARGADGRLIPFYPGKQAMRAVVEFENTGERLLTPEGRIEVRNVFGKVVHRYPVKRFTVYPEGEAGIQMDLRKLPSFGMFRASLELESEAGKQTRKLGSFVLAPWWVMGLLAAAVIYAGYQAVRWWLDRRAMYRELEAEEQVLADGEEIFEHDDLDDGYGSQRIAR